MQSYVELSTLVLHHVSNLFANVTFEVITFLMHYFSFRAYARNAYACIFNTTLTQLSEVTK